jgi:hypothetical protein
MPQSNTARAATDEGQQSPYGKPSSLAVVLRYSHTTARPATAIPAGRAEFPGC